MSTHRIQNSRGLNALVDARGAALIEMWVPDREGSLGNVLERQTSHRYAGVTVGRVANRVDAGRFQLDGDNYQLTCNEGLHHLHGGGQGSLDKLTWDAGTNPSSVTFRAQSPDGDEGYPGHLDVSVTYSLTDQDELVIEYHATTTRPTPVNLTNHAYWNLGGALQNHDLLIRSSLTLQTNEQLIPTGVLEPVEGSGRDFTRTRPVGSLPFDHTCVLDGDSSAATLSCRASGRSMIVSTTEPTLQLFTTDTALCLEAQGFPDAVNHPEFPSVILRPGQAYRQTTRHQFVLC